MIVNRDDCKFQIVNHNKISSNLNMFQMIKMTIIIEQKAFEFYYTNKGWLEDNKKEYFCSKKFLDFQAKKFILNLPESILI